MRHCIGVDPYYLTHKASEVGYHPEMILAGRKLNDNMGNFIAEKTVSEIVKKGINPIDAKITILGIAFKENCPDLRNTKVLTIIDRLSDFNCTVSVVDHWVEKQEAINNFNINLLSIEDISDQDAVIIAVGHLEFCNLEISFWKRLLKLNGVIIDVKSLYS